MLSRSAGPRPRPFLSLALALGGRAPRSRSRLVLTPNPHLPEARPFGRIGSTGTFACTAARAASTSASAGGQSQAPPQGLGPGRNVASGQWSVSSPKQLNENLSQYIIGQERAKRVLSVAVFNHYLRVTPIPPPSDDPSAAAASTSGSTTASSAPIIPPPPRPASAPAPGRTAPSPPTTPSPSPSPRARSVYSRKDDLSDFSPPPPDPSRPGAALDDGSGAQRDSTRAVGANGDGADPTLTHDLLDLRSREGMWSRDGFFYSSRPSRAEQDKDKDRESGKSTRRRAGAAGPSSSNITPSAASSASPFATSGLPPRYDAESARSSSLSSGRSEPRDPGVAQQKVELEEGFLATASGGAGGGGASARSRDKEDVLVEKSNVLMIGPTGTGKTLMAKTLARVLDVPFASCDATTYTQAGYVGDDVENCVLRLLQSADYDVSRAEVGIIHIDEIDKLARRGGGEYGSWGGGRDVGGEGVQQALLRLLEGTTLTLQAKPPANWSPGPPPPTGPGSVLGGAGLASPPPSQSPPPASPASRAAETAGASPGAPGGPPEWDPNNPMNRGFGAGGKKGVREGLPGFSGGGGGGSSGKTETFVVDTSNILFVLSGAFVGLESIVQRRLGKGSIGFGAPLPAITPSSESSAPAATSTTSATPLKGLSTADLTAYGLIPEFLGRLPVLSTLHPLSVDDLVRILVEPRNALVRQYQAQFDKVGAELAFTERAVREVARVGLERGGGARGLRGILEEVLLDAMYDAPGSSIRYVLITENVVKGEEPALYFSRGQRVLFDDARRAEDVRGADEATANEEMGVDGEEEGEERLRAVG